MLLLWLLLLLQYCTSCLIAFSPCSGLWLLLLSQAHTSSHAGTHQPQQQQYQSQKSGHHVIAKDVNHLLPASLLVVLLSIPLAWWGARWKARRVLCVHLLVLPLRSVESASALSNITKTVCQESGLPRLKTNTAHCRRLLIRNGRAVALTPAIKTETV
jgi:hypothetical protein